MKKIKLNLLRYVAKGILLGSLLAIVPVCAGGGYQPQVPEHLQD